MHDLEVMILVGLVAWWHECKQCKRFKKDLSKELMLVAWHLTRWWNWRIPEDKKKEIEWFLIDEK